MRISTVHVLRSKYSPKALTPEGCQALIVHF